MTVIPGSLSHIMFVLPSFMPTVPPFFIIIVLTVMSYPIITYDIILLSYFIFFDHLLA